MKDKRSLLLCITVMILAISFSGSLLGLGLIYTHDDLTTVDTQSWSSSARVVMRSNRLESERLEAFEVQSEYLEVRNLQDANQELQAKTESNAEPNAKLTAEAGFEASNSSLQILALTFATVFVAEMGDKTQLATMLMTAQSQSPWGIFLGSASALVTASLISVILGGSLAHFIPDQVLQLLAGIGFIVIGGFVLWTELSDQPVADNEDRVDNG